MLKGPSKLEDDEVFQKDNFRKPIEAENKKPSTPAVMVLKPPAAARCKAKGVHSRSKNKKSTRSQPKTSIEAEKSPNREKSDGKDIEPVDSGPDSMQPVSPLAKNTLTGVKKVRKSGKRGGKKNCNKYAQSPLSVTKAPAVLEQGPTAVEDAVYPELPTGTKYRHLPKSSSLIHKNDSGKPYYDSPASEADTGEFQIQWELL